MNTKFDKSDLKLLAFFYAVAIPVSLLGYGDYNDWFVPIAETITYFTFSLFALYIIVFILFPKYFPEKKIIHLFVITVLFLLVLGVIEVYIYKWISGNVWTKATPIKIALYGFQSSVENAGILIGLFMGKKFYQAQTDIAKKEKEKKENELLLLKSQIDPHFLFNNLNTVDSLIDSDPTLAKEYINRLSQLYRYLIKTKDDEVVPLDDELDFARNYIFLLQRRFGDTYQFNIHIKTNTSHYLIPPGALQTLLENVVKHNSGKENDGLKVLISVNDQEIIVSNELNPKPYQRDTTGTGLKNLMARYKLLSDRDITINKEANFSVHLPMLKSI